MENTQEKLPASVVDKVLNHLKINNGEDVLDGAIEHTLTSNTHHVSLDKKGYLVHEEHLSEVTQIIENILSFPMIREENSDTRLNNLVTYENGGDVVGKIDKTYIEKAIVSGMIYEYYTTFNIDPQNFTDEDIENISNSLQTFTTGFQKIL